MRADGTPRIQSDADLLDKLRSIDGQGYKAYQAIAGEYQFPRFRLSVDHVQGDPFASPSRLRIRLSQSIARFPHQLFSTAVRRLALQDYLARRFARAVERSVKGQRGIGRSGLIAIDAGGQEILQRNCCSVEDRFVEARFTVGLPAAGRTVLGREAAAMLLEEIPRLAESLVYSGPDRDAMHRHVLLAEDQASIRSVLEQRRLVAFVANGSILPRASGSSNRPLGGPEVVEFISPPELQVEFKTPNRGLISGMGIPRGVTLVVGGGFHGKSTLLAALSRGVYNHIPGDGREYVLTRADAVRIRSEDGRSVERVNITPFITNLPFGRDTSAFSTDNASGSTSQATNIIEALEAGAGVILIDEDTSATNFMIRDARMQRLVAKAHEPITPFIDQVRNLLDDYNVSSVLVVGGSGDYLDVADTVIVMRDYLPAVVTESAKHIALEMPTQRLRESRERFGPVTKRAVVPQSLNPMSTIRGGCRVQARGLQSIDFGPTTIDLGALEQLVDPSQTRAIADILLNALNRGYFEGDVPMVDAVTRVLTDIERNGIGIISPFSGYSTDYALPRLHETVAALNRLRGLKAKQIGG